MRPAPLGEHAGAAGQKEKGKRMAGRFRGTVKWFNAGKGYGFIGTKDGPDVFVHHSAIEMDGFRTLKEGDEVEFDIVQGAKGSQADGVTKV